MKKDRLLLSLILFFVIGNQLFVFAQGVKSPLLDSWKQYMKMKQESEFGLEWISLGPVLNSAPVLFRFESKKANRIKVWPKN